MKLFLFMLLFIELLFIGWKIGEIQAQVKEERVVYEVVEKCPPVKVWPLYPHMIRKHSI